MSEWRHELVGRIAVLNLRPEREAEIVEELSQHLDDEVRTLIAAGATEEAARAAALAELDAPGELTRRLGEILGRQPLRLPPPGTPARGQWLRARWQDIRYSLRSLRHSPGFAAAVIVTLGLTIGPTTALLSIGNWLVWRPVPGVVQPDRLGLAIFGQRTARNDLNVASLSYSSLETLRRGAKTVTAITGVIESRATIAAGSLPARENGYGIVTGDFFETLGIRASIGRALSSADDAAAEGARVAVVSDGLARRAFGNPDLALDKHLLVNGHDFTVVGVAPREFAGTTPLSRVEIWISGAAYASVNERTSAIAPTDGRASMRFSSFLIRLAPSASFEQATTELTGLVPSLGDRSSVREANFTRVHAELTPGIGLRQEQRDVYRRQLTVLTALGGVLLVLGCANVANLMIGRGARLRRERAVRLALGASRGRLAMLQLTESVLLAGAGAFMGLLLAFGLKDFFARLLVPVLTTWADFGVPLDYRILSITLGVSVLCGLGAGLAPALLAAMTFPTHIAIEGRTVTGARRLRAGFAIVQLALSLALLTGAFMLIATLRNYWAIDLGFNPAGVTVHRMTPEQQGYSPERSVAYYRSVFERIRSAPGMIAVAYAGSATGPRTLIRVLDPKEPGAEGVRTFAHAVTGEFFGALEIQVVKGRVFSESEAWAVREASPPLVMISESFSRRFFGDADPIGQRVTIAATSRDPATELTVVGVTKDVRWSVTGGNASLADPRLQMYLPLTHPASGGLRAATLQVKSQLPAQAVGQLVESAAMAVDPVLPVQSTPLQRELEYQLRDRTTFAWVLSMLGWLGLALAAVGLYGLLAQSVAERTREFGIRIAVGSGRARIFGLVIRQAGWVGVIGTVAGVTLAYYGTPLIEAQLFGVTRGASGVYVAAAASLLGVVFLAGLWPAHAATRIDPVEALRAE